MNQEKKTPPVKGADYPSMAPVAAEEGAAARPKDPGFPYTLIIVAGAMAFINGILVLAMDTSHVEKVQFEGGDVGNAIEILMWAGILEIILGTVIVALGILGRFSMPALGVAGAVLAILSLGPLLLSTILGVTALVLLLKYRSMLERAASASKRHR